MLKITDKIYINEDDVEVRFIRSPGPGGQHVNKVESAVQIRFDANFFQALDMSMFDRLKKLSGQRMNSEGVVIMTANSTRSQIRNREEVMVRLVELLKKAATIPKLRKKTRPTFASKTRRIEGKKRKGSLKKLRSKETSE
ncbi:MAG: alternative ribosome rescue aminoacyl-tRNA hydrolase ArfB [Emcibacteraceae bacterium]|jgi:ribosome-associated protein|nr:alternative ribosome rescue aminoacyl-tRNA hydrolase ArfB [Emcibacteraceae bacterium]|tara:strand:- start:53 stop:472 length:420 start_codon:yes stop_codon:yes gene_type:complete